MANGHGGKRTPAKPAPVSGPGRLSRRTDGGPSKMALPDAEYGEQAAFQEAQSGAPMGTPSPAAPAGMSGGGAGGMGLVPLDAPTQRPGEPVTAGAPLGPGVGPEALGLGPGAEDAEDLEKLRAYLPALMEMANRPESTASFRNYVRTLRAKL